MFKTREEIESWLKKMEIENYTIRDGVVDVDDNVSFYNKNLKYLPVQFGVVQGSFYCSCNKLTSLEGCPWEVKSWFFCSNNNLTSLEGCPLEVGKDFDCSWNKLTSLKGCPLEVGKDFDCSWNKLTSLKHLPRIRGKLLCDSYLHNDPEYLKWKLHYELSKYV